MWKLPDELGGGTYRGHLVQDEHDPTLIWVYLDVPGVRKAVRVVREALEEVKTLPLEPAEDAVILDSNGTAWQRENNQWYPAIEIDTTRRGDYASIGSLRWDLLNRLFGPLSVLAVVETDQS